MEKERCCDCGRIITQKEIDEREVYEYQGEYLCQSCYEDNYFTCDSCGVIEHRDYGTYVDYSDEFVCESCLDNNYFYCEQCQRWVPNGDSVSINNGYGDYYDICDSCFNNGEYYSCDSCGDYFHEDNVNWRNDSCYCDSCYDSNVTNNGIYEYHQFNDWELFDNGENPTYYIGKEIELEPLDRGDNNTSGVLKAIENNINAVGMHDGSLRSGGVEVVTHPESWEYLQAHKQDYINFFNEIKEINYGDAGGCGLHFHVTRPNENVVSRIIVLLESFKDEIKKLSRRNGNFSWSKFLSDDSYSDTEKIKYQSTKWLKDKYLNSWHERYYALNLCNQKTIEFRFFNGANNFEEFWSAMQFIHNIMEIALNEEREINTITWKELLIGDELIEQAKKLDVYYIYKLAKDTTDIMEKYEIALQKAKDEIKNVLRNLANYVNREISELDIKEVKTRKIEDMKTKLDDFMSKIKYRQQYLNRITDLYNALNRTENTVEMKDIKNYWANTKSSYPVNSKRYKRYNNLIEKAIKNYESEVR